MDFALANEQKSPPGQQTISVRSPIFGVAKPTPASERLILLNRHDLHRDPVQLASEHVAHLIKRAEKFITVVVKPHDLLSYCRATGQQPSYTMLEAVAVKKANE